MRWAGAGTRVAERAATTVVGPLLLLLLAQHLPSAGGYGRSEARLVSEHFSQAPQKLSFYSWYGNARLFHFRVPPDTVLLRWLLHVSWDRDSTCTDAEITVHFRYGAPPVINPLGTSFPDDTMVQPSFHVRALLSTMLLGNTTVNMSHPAPGDWFVVAHLPPSSQKIEVKGFPSCVYSFQPDMLVTRVVEVTILEPDVPLPQILVAHPSYLKIFVPEYTQELRLEIQGCVSNMSLGCPVRLTVGVATLPSNFQKVLTCTGSILSCRLLLPSPPWGQWLQVIAESLEGPHVSVAFSAEAALTVCRPWSMTFQHLVQNSTNQSYDASANQLSQSSAPQDLSRNGGMGGGPFCLLSYSVMREDIDVLSVRFQPLDGVLVLVHSDKPSVMRLRLDTGMDSGGSLTITLKSNKTEVTNDILVLACVNAASPFLNFSASLNCTTGWRGWSCTDNSTAQTVAQQRVATLLLTLSNLMFLAPIAVCVHRAFLVEASVYLYTMFISTFYHACDQPGEAVLCILSYDTLQYCDFLGSGVSTWVTILSMARLKTVLKHVLFLLGTLVLAMSLHLNRIGIWNIMGPCLFAFVIMTSMWVYRCRHRHQCYPTSWQRWAFYLLPGIAMASMGITIYVFLTTNDNYYYTHSIWHVLLAGSVAFLLPPRDKQAEPWSCSQKLPCHYQICKNDRDELYTVT
ncbi:post-GPI attachment to proteins factor 6 isoform X3 [Cavia porcellus]|uniref:post-GPI attachment to proteins factor 6 isoform X3 n=1 Tax=Cavia porcellus TaxID=10141 RepID=UPI002FDF721B